MTNTNFLHITNDDLSINIANQTGGRGYSYISLYVKDHILPYIDLADKYKTPYDILYLSKDRKNLILYEKCELILVSITDNMFKFKYPVSKKEKIKYSKIKFNQIKLKQMLKCY